MLQHIENLKTRYLFTILALLSILPVIIYISIPLFGDDYSWFLFIKENQQKSILNVLLVPKPFEYFRPVMLIFFELMYKIVGDNAVVYRLFCGFFQILMSVTLYHLFLKLYINKSIAFLSSALFAVLAIHAEVIYNINCLSIPVSDFLVLWGIIFFLKSEKKIYIVFSTIFFLLALFCRESSVSYIFLVSLVFFYTRKKTISQFVVVLILPLILYFAFIYILVLINPLSFSQRNYGISSGFLVNVYKFFHMFLVSIFPLKLLFNFIGYDYYDSFRNSFMGYSNPFWFYCLLTIFALVSITAAILIYKVLRKKIIFPLLFFLSCIIVYIPPGYVAERFTYLASAGICLLLVLTLVNIKQQKYAMLIFYFFFLINFAALFLKGNSFYTYTSLYNNSLKDLYNQIISSKQVSGAIMIENLPTPFYGNLFVSMQNFNDTFKYFNPSDTIEFYLKNNITPIDVIKPLSRTFAFDIQTFKFNPINK